MTSTGSPSEPDKRERRRHAAQLRMELAQTRARQARRRRVLSVTASIAAVGAVAVLAGYGLSRAGRGDPGAQAAFDRHTQTVDFTLPSFTGGTLSSAQLRGKPAVINFYASWCTVCDAEMPDFQAVHEQAGDTVAFVGVNPQSNDSDSSQAAMVKRTGVRYPTVRDRNDQLLRLFNTTGGLPTTLFVDAHGKVVRIHNGAYDQRTLKAAIAQYLGVII